MAICFSAHHPTRRRSNLCSCRPKCRPVKNLLHRSAPGGPGPPPPRWACRGIPPPPTSGRQRPTLANGIVSPKGAAHRQAGLELNALCHAHCPPSNWARRAVTSRKPATAQPAPRSPRRPPPCQVGLRRQVARQVDPGEVTLIRPAWPSAPAPGIAPPEADLAAVRMRHLGQRRPPSPPPDHCGFHFAVSFRLPHARCSVPSIVPGMLIRCFQIAIAAGKENPKQQPEPIAPSFGPKTTAPTGSTTAAAIDATDTYRLPKKTESTPKADRERNMGEASDHPGRVKFPFSPP
ncbi:MAG: hypothetical protein CM1200mP34_3900 [Verrucomicrobiales bacterium]|nr:MAG: hypothetical protein CM1200mP34_3900 [Verrucomicrobiales bacterium]